MFSKYVFSIVFSFYYVLTITYSQQNIIKLESYHYCSDDSISINFNNYINTQLDIYLEYYEDNSHYDIISNYIGDGIIFKLLDMSFCNKPLRLVVKLSENSTLIDALDSIYIYKSPEITEQSKSTIVCKGNTQQLWVDCDGYNLKYQWFKDNKELIGEQTRIVQINNFDESDVGVYFCEIYSESPCNIIQSDYISLYSTQGPSFTLLPQSIMYKNGSDVTFTSKIHSNSLITDTGLTLQWYKDTIDISTNINRLIKLKDNNKYSGSKTENLLIRNLITGDKSSYWCIVSTGCGSDTAKVMIGDNIYFKIIKETGDFTDCEGTTCKLRVRVEQYAKGTIEYQWYNPGYKKIVESEKFKGTKTRELTINNVTRKDNNAYYVLVTLKESGYSLRCDHFYVEPTYKPEIMIQPVDFIIKNRENNPTVYGQTYVGVGISNRDICSFRWFRNDTLVRVQWTMFSSNYLLGPNNSTRPAKKTDVGLYKCQISNNCGTVWSDSAWVVWGYEDVEQCEGKQAELVVDELNTETEKYYYKWYYKGKLLKESNKLSGTNTSKLTINNINEEEGGNYDVYAINALTLKEKYLGKVYLMINLSPQIAKELPDTIYKSGKYLKNSPISVKVTGSILFYQIYKENIPYGDVISKESFNIYDEYQVFYYGGSDNDLPDGNYYIKFWNECGEKNSKKFVVLHQPKPVGTNIPDDIISEVDNELYKSERGFSIFPNPTTDFITIDVKPSEGSRVEIYNVMGFLIQPTQLRKDLTPTILEDEVLSIDISNLLPGVYFVKIGNRVEKFVKL